MQRVFVPVIGVCPFFSQRSQLLGISLAARPRIETCLDRSAASGDGKNQISSVAASGWRAFVGTPAENSITCCTRLEANRVGSFSPLI